METQVPRPTAQVANAVYRGLIDQEKRKTYDSIATLNNEISQLQGKPTPLLNSADETLDQIPLTRVQTATFGLTMKEPEPSKKFFAQSHRVSANEAPSSGL